ncbi:hypothetical protein GGP51_002569 [Salinibacter ruber]|uniref:DUF6174 domain-containing protein n=2 Tax=Salinibacter ruber TaxID=146919 RepID=UPI002167B008|nr:DUF6174 domain-containing protein [Salinibacter ruber]MCS3823614.1 hypothetical protein [Salinibacter ruber]MCS4191077.1 hypothetical protein [Salinibacter ruber]
MMNRNLLCFFILVMGGTLAGCDFITGSDREQVQSQIRQRIESRRDQWSSQNIHDYSFVYSQRVGKKVVDSVKVYVKKGRVDSICTSVHTSEKRVLVGTVDSFFSLILKRVGEKKSQFSADFEQELGYPTEYTAKFANRPDHVVSTFSVKSLEGAGP